MKLSIVILAAGQGTRMRSRLPKVLHPVAGRPMLQHVIDTARSLDPEAIYVVYGHGGELVRERLAGIQVIWVEQERQLGTGHAVQQAVPDIPSDHVALVLYGDVPLVQSSTLVPLVDEAETGRVALLTVRLPDPGGYGRIIRNSTGHVTAIVEHKDATPQQREIQEVNTGLLAAPAEQLKGWLERLNNHNAQGEYYLTDVAGLAVGDGVDVVAVRADDPEEMLGANDRAQLAALERAYQRRVGLQLMRDGVALADPERVDVRGSVRAGHDCFVDVNVVFEGEVRLGDGVHVESNCVIRNTVIEDHAVIHSHSSVDGAHIGAAASVGPFARVRPGTRLAAAAKVGNFVETKNADIGEGSKINHLSYVGDADVGDQVNVGAGTITCNYDGANKHRTHIGDRAFIGSGTQLVAPVSVGADATIGAGSTITQDTPDDELTIARARQVTIKGWKRPRKERE